MNTNTLEAPTTSIRVAVGSHAPNTAAVRRAKDAFRAFAATQAEKANGGELDYTEYQRRTKAGFALAGAFLPEIERRGGLTELVTWGYGRGWYRKVTALETVDADAHRGLALLTAGAWHTQHKRYPGRRVTLAYLVGMDDSGLWATRVPGTVETVDEALDAITPAAAKGRETRRQGDIILVRMNRASTTTPSGVIKGSHIWDADARTLTHNPEDGRAHRTVTAPAEWPGVKLVPQTRFEHLRAPARD